MIPLFLSILILYITLNIRAITFIQYIHPLSFAGQLSGKNLPGVPSRELTSGLPYSKPTHYQLNYATPLKAFTQRKYRVTIYGPMIYTALRIRFLMRADR